MYIVANGGTVKPPGEEDFGTEDVLTGFFLSPPLARSTFDYG